MAARDRAAELDRLAEEWMPVFIRLKARHGRAVEL